MGELHCLVIPEGLVASQELFGIFYTPDLRLIQTQQYRLSKKISRILGLQSISRDALDNVSHPRRLD